MDRINADAWWHGLGCRVDRRIEWGRGAESPSTAATTSAATTTSAAASRLRLAIRREVHVRAGLDEDAHRVDVQRVRGAPERGGPFDVLEAAVGVAAVVECEVPGLCGQTSVRIRSS